MDELRTLKDEAARAMGRGQWQQAATAYAELAAKEPTEGTWPLRAGDAARKLGKHQEAIHWYERAAATYGERGFIVRAIAVGKMIASLDPGNDRVLRLLDAAQKQSAGPPPLSRASGARPDRAAPPAPPRPSPAKASTPTRPPPATPRAAPPAKPPPLPEEYRKRQDLSGDLSPSDRGDSGPPLVSRLTGPPLNPQPTVELDVGSMEIVFDDVDDGIPISASDIIPIEDLEQATGEVEPDEEQLFSRLPAFPLFQVLPQGAFLQVAKEMKFETLEAGSVIVRQGDPGTTLYAIIDGQAMVYTEGCRDEPLAMLEAGDVFGEMALVLDQPRAATVEALTDLELFEMDRELFRDVIQRHPELGDVISRMIKRRLVENVMATAPLFQQLDPSMRKELMVRFEVREVPPETVLVKQGTASDGLYLLLSGTIEIRVDGQKRGTLKRGQTFGAAALIDPGHRSPAGFHASGDCLVLRLPRSGFQEVISFYPPVLAHLAEIAEERQVCIEDDCVGVV